MYRGLFCCVGLSIVTSEGLAGLLVWRAISPDIKAHNSDPRGTQDKGDDTNASLNVRKLVSKVSSGATPGGGDMLRGLGDNLNLISMLGYKNKRVVNLNIKIREKLFYSIYLRKCMEEFRLAGLRIKQ